MTPMKQSRLMECECCGEETVHEHNSHHFMEPDRPEWLCTECSGGNHGE